jgi:fucose permease
MNAGQLSNDISLFYVGYIIFELPATLFLKKVTANFQLGIALMAWGTFTTL